MGWLDLFHKTDEKKKRPFIFNFSLTINIIKEDCADPNLATWIEVTEVSGINFKIKANNIMSVQFKKGEKVQAKITGKNATNPNATINTLSAESDNTGIFTIGDIDQNAQTVWLLGVADGQANVTYKALNTNNAQLSVQDAVTIDDTPPPPDLLATSLSIEYGTPVAQ